MICHQYRCVFVHIPKCAGQSIEHVFLNLAGLTWETRAPLLLRRNVQPDLGPPRLAHLKAEEYVRFKYLTQDTFDQYFKFAFVRNPWSRAVSLYKYMGYGETMDFRTFVSGVFKNSIFKERLWFVGPQSDFIYTKDGRLLVDYIGRFEDLQAGFDIVCQKAGIPATQLPHVNQSGDSNDMFGMRQVGELNRLLRLKNKAGIPSHRTWQDYYDKASIDCISRLYRRDIEIFGYQFE